MKILEREEYINILQQDSNKSPIDSLEEKIKRAFDSRLNDKRGEPAVLHRNYTDRFFIEHNEINFKCDLLYYDSKIHTLYVFKTLSENTKINKQRARDELNVWTQYPINLFEFAVREGYLVYNEDGKLRGELVFTISDSRFYRKYIFDKNSEGILNNYQNFFRKVLNL
ncbi:MAG: hypothetical protein PWP03_587 [Candidatus Woesearchaeota archaeon]|nr:hypothetical protein [Candidatus Woesearchaeota archaeon]MDN5327949.1 hypothetical protein [Candidatus Woesearchaeota archaeon]